MADAGAEVLLVPARTESVRGYWRARVGRDGRARWRNGCVVVHASALGEADWLPGAKCVAWRGRPLWTFRFGFPRTTA